MSIQYLPQGIPVVSSSFAVSGSYTLTAPNKTLLTTASIAELAFDLRGPTGSSFTTRNAESSLVDTGSQGLTLLVYSTGSAAFRFATSSFSTLYGPNVGPIDFSGGGGVGYNPPLNLVRNRTYQFVIRGTPPAGAISIFFVTNNGSGAYTFSGGADGDNPTLTLVRGYRYEFRVDAVGHPFWIQTTNGAYDEPNLYNTQVYNSGSESGTIIFNVPHDAPNNLYYVCRFHSVMRGTMNIVDDGTQRLAIQTNSGSFVSSSVFNQGVINNGTKSGSLTFTVPQSAPSILYYQSMEGGSTARGTINITG